MGKFFKDIDDCGGDETCTCRNCGKEIYCYRYKWAHTEDDGACRRPAPMHGAHIPITHVQDLKTWERHIEIHQRGIYRIRFGKQEIRVLLEPGDKLRIEQIEKLPRTAD
jgi:hypothetical protein